MAIKKYSKVKFTLSDDTQQDVYLITNTNSSLTMTANITKGMFYHAHFTANSIVHYISGCFYVSSTEVHFFYYSDANGTIGKITAKAIVSDTISIL